MLNTKDTYVSNIIIALWVVVSAWVWWTIPSPAEYTPPPHPIHTTSPSDTHQPPADTALTAAIQLRESVERLHDLVIDLKIKSDVANEVALISGDLVCQ